MSGSPAPAGPRLTLRRPLAPPATSLSFFAKYAVKLARRDAWVQLNADNLLKSTRSINETSFTNLLIYGIATPVVWRITTGVRF